MQGTYLRGLEKEQKIFKKCKKFHPSKASPIRVLCMSKKKFSLKTITLMLLTNDLVLEIKDFAGKH